MKKFNIKKILVPLDFSETALLALEHGAHMAALFNADLMLMHVVKPNMSVLITENMPMPLDIMLHQEEWAAGQLSKLEEDVRKQYPSLKISSECNTGFVCSTIVDAAEKNNVDLIVMGTHGSSGFTERFIGSNAYKVVNDASCPVLTIQMYATEKGFKNIVLPIDHSFYSRQKVVHAVELAQHYGSTVHILGLSHTEEKTELNKLNIKLEQVQDYLEEHGVLSSKQVKTGTNYAKLTMSYAEALGADLIMIMTEWEEDMTGLFIGPFARQIVNHSKIPVMSIRPDIKPTLVESGLSWMEQPG